MPGKKVGPKHAAHEFLIDMARKSLLDSKVIPSVYTRPDPQQICDYFLVNMAGHKGNAAILYASVGTSYKYTGAFDFGILICPGLISLSLNLNEQLTKTKNALLLIHQALPYRLISVKSRLPNEDSPQWGTKIENTIEKPVTFMQLNGSGIGLSFGLTAAASLGSGTSLADIGDEISLGCFGFTLAGISASAGRSENIYFYNDNQPKFYKNAREGQLMVDFLASLRKRHTHYLKREVGKYLREVKKEFVDLKSEPKYTNLKKAFKSLPSFNFPGFRASTAKVTDKLSEIERILSGLNSDQNDPDITKISKEIESYKKEIMEASAQQFDLNGSDKPDSPAGPPFCFLTVKNKKNEYSINASIGNNPVDGAMGGGSGIGTNVRDGSDKVKAASTYTIPSITIGVGGERKVTHVRTFYRYQTFAHGREEDSRIIYTQDVFADYSQTDITFAMKTGLDAGVGRDVDLEGIHIEGDSKFKKFAKEAKKFLIKAEDGYSWGKRNLQYKAVAIYWNHRNSRDMTEVDTLNGSGLSFGCSMRIQDLIRLSLEEKQEGNEEDKKNLKIQPYAALLRVKNEEFREFVKYFLVDDERSVIGFESLEKYGAVLIESSFRLKNSVKISMANKGNNYSQTQLEDLTEKEAWQDFFKGDSIDADAAGLQLEAIRVRLRLGDHTSNTRSVFRLGLYLFGSGFGFNIDAIEAAGNEGILEIHTHHFIPSDQVPERVSVNLRDGVPPVMLMPHHFNE